jgi:hypothetical protein
MTWLKTFWEKLKGWRTILFSAAVAVLGVLQTADWATILTPRYVGPAMLGVAIMVAVLRSVTDSAVGRK